MSGTTSIGDLADGSGEEEHDHPLWKGIRSLVWAMAILMTCGALTTT